MHSTGARFSEASLLRSSGSPADRDGVAIDFSATSVDIRRDVHFSTRAVSRYRDLKGWSGELFEARRTLAGRAARYGQVVVERPAWVSAADERILAYLLLDPFVFPLVRTHPMACRGPDSRPLSAITCLVDSSRYVAPPAQPPREPEPDQPMPRDAEELAAGITFSRHCLERYVERVEPGLSSEQAGRRLRAALAESGRPTRKAPYWYTESRPTSFFAHCMSLTGEEMVLPVVHACRSATASFLAVSCVSRSHAERTDPAATEIFQILRETYVPEERLGAMDPATSPALVRRRLVDRLVARGEVHSEAPPWAPLVPAADAYVGIEGELLMGLVWTGALPRQPLLAHFVYDARDLRKRSRPSLAAQRAVLG